MTEMHKVSVITPVYRSQRWLPGFFKALGKLETSGGLLEVVLVDNDPSALPLEEYHVFAGELDLKVLTNDRNLGFASACNRGAQAATGELLLFLNVDTEIGPKTLTLLRERLLSQPGCVIAEARQTPHEHPKFYWPGTGYTDWCSATCCLIRRDTFLDSGGFDELFFMYGEDVDLSFRLADRGYKLCYVPEATCTHYVDDKSAEELTERSHHMIRADLLLRARYGGLRELAAGVYLNLTRTLLRRKGQDLVRALAALREGARDCPKLLMERWSEQERRRRRYFEDSGAFTLHHRFPPPATTSLSAEAKRPFTVIIATENRDFQVAPLVETLLDQMEDLGLGELIVVDHGPVIGAADGMAERFASSERFHVIDHSHGNPTDARNAALRSAKGDIVIFVDDDAIPGPDFLRRHLALHLEGDVVQGSVKDCWPVAGSPFRRYLRDHLRGQARRSEEEAGEDAWRRFSTTNASVKRELLNKVKRSTGHFSRHLWHDGAADVELAWRLSKTAPILQAPSLQVLRRRVPRLRGFLAGRFRAGFASAQVAAHFPKLSADLGDEPGPRARKLLWRSALFTFVLTPLAAPACLLEYFTAPSSRMNPVATWWYRAAGRMLFDMGRFFHQRFGEAINR